MVVKIVGKNGFSLAFLSFLSEQSEVSIVEIACQEIIWPTTDTP